MLSVFLAHSPADAPFARELTTFLELGCDEVRFTPDSEIRAGDDLISTAETGLGADVVILLISNASNPPRWFRERWEPVLTGTRFATVLLDECVFPLLLRRSSGFFDATGNRLDAMRRLKRWLWGARFGTTPAMTFSPDLDTLYRVVADQPGTLTVSGDVAERFARQAARDFATVVWIPAGDRTLTQIVGELGSQLEVLLDGEPEENCRLLREALGSRRCLVVLDGPGVPVDSLLPAGRTSILYTEKPSRIVEDNNPDFATARRLVVARRFAEAYELLYQLMNAGIEPESCARELVWICEHWDRVDEANALRFQCARDTSSEQLLLF